MKVWTSQAQQTELLIKHQLEQTQALSCMMSALIGSLQPPADQASSALISALQDETQEVQGYIKELALKIFHSQLPASEVLTPDELRFYQQYHPSEINTFLTGDPLSPPEWRSYLVELPEESDDLLAPEDLQPVPGPSAQVLPQPAGVPQPGLPEPAIPAPSKSKAKPSFARSALYSSTKKARQVFSKAKEKLTGRKKDQPDGNNNFKGSGRASTFYVDLDFEVLEVAL